MCKIYGRNVKDITMDLCSMSNQRFSLRDYQQEAIQNVIRARRAGYNRLLVCLPTGAGKL